MILPIAAPKFQFSFVIAHIWHPHFRPLPTLPFYKNKAWKKTPLRALQGLGGLLLGNELYRSGTRTP